MNYGWKKDRHDPKDRIRMAATPSVDGPLPTSVDLSNQFPDVFDQGDLGSCTGNSIAGAFAYELNRQGLAAFVPSRLFIYYNEREMEGTVNEDAGAEIRDGIKTLNAFGVCPEDLWPYQVYKFATKPPQEVYDAAHKHLAVSYHRVIQDEHQMKACLADKQPFVFGFMVYPNMESKEMAQIGKLTMPDTSDESKCLGGHAVCCVGYNDEFQEFLIRNSWGQDWGMGGYFTMPYKYMLDPELASDFWTICLVS